MNKFTFSLSMGVIGLLTWLIHQAQTGDTTALITLSIIGAVTLISFGAAITMTMQYIATKRENGRFAANAQENLAIMQGMQRLQNDQNTQLMKQVKQLPIPKEQPQPALFNIDDAIFEELE